jgi:hypothetical protein
MNEHTPDVVAQHPRTAEATEAFKRNAARRRVRKHLADWDTMPADTFDDAEIAGMIVAQARAVARRAGITLTGRTAL